MSHLLGCHWTLQSAAPHGSKLLSKQEAPQGENRFQTQIGPLISEIFLNLYVDFYYFKCINPSKCFSLALAPVCSVRGLHESKQLLGCCEPHGYLGIAALV